MPVILAITYQKKLGLPNYSSHSCSVSLTVEIPDVSVVGQETARLYELLQSSVDAEIQNVGFMPDATTYGMQESTSQNAPQSNGNGHSSRHNGNGHRYNGNNGGGYNRPQSSPQRNTEMWNCTDGQKGLILKVVNESKMPKEELEEMAQQMFGVGVKQLDKMQASQIIEELLEKTGKKVRRSNWNGRQTTPAR